jgi:hypothetical protein
MNEIFTIIKLNDGYNLTLPQSEREGDKMPLLFKPSKATLKELFEEMANITNC